MEPIDRRTTAARLLTLRTEPNAGRLIAQLLGVAHMAPLDAVRTAEEIDQFIESGDATVASQLIHSATVRAATASTHQAANMRGGSDAGRM